MRKLLIVIFICSLYTRTNAQGCVAIKSNGGTCTMANAENEKSDDWILSLNYRYFKSYKHFVGTVEQKQRQTLGTEVINHINAFDVDLLRIINRRWSIGIFTPISYNERSSLYEHDNKNRYTTSSFGLGDMRIAGYYWLVDPMKHSKLNVQTGFGIKFPTGNYKYEDYFHKNDSTKILGPVDQSIQLGDGGTGLTLELNGYYRLTHQLGIYGNFYYLSNPMNVNGVSTGRGSAVPASSIANGSDVMSVPDQYMWRAGIDYGVQNFTFSAGIRKECIPVYDLIGRSDGFRRPGYVVSAEPVIAYKFKRMQAYVSVPYAIERNRTQSVPDKIKTELTGVYSQGDAAFADYTVNIGISFSLKK